MVGVLRLSTALVVAAVLECGAASAQEIPSAREGDSDMTRRSAAAALFGEGRARMADGAVAEACARFAESDRLEPAAGTKLNLADCYERDGRLTSAWITFGAAESDARRLGREAWVTIARTRAQLLAPRLPRLTLVLAGSERAATEVRIDATKLNSAALQTPIPVDPGPHEVEAFDGDVRIFHASVNAEVAKETTVAIVPSRPAPSPPAAAVAAPSPTPASLASDASPAPPVVQSRSRTLPIGLIGVGVGGLAVGAATGLLALRDNTLAKAACPIPSACHDQGAVDQSAAAHRDALVSDIGILAGAALVTAGAVLLFTHAAPSSRAPRVGCAPIDGGWIFGVSGQL